MQAYITKQAFDLFKESQKDKDGNSLNITDLQDKVVILSKWTVEMAQTNSAENYTSYAGLEMKIIINEMKVKSEEKVSLGSYPINLYRDDESKMLISYFIKSCQKECLKTAIKGDRIVDASSVLGGKEEIIKVAKHVS